MVPPAIGYNRFQCPAIPPGNPNGRRKNTGLNFLLSGSTFRPRLAQNTLLSFLVFLYCSPINSCLCRGCQRELDHGSIGLFATILSFDGQPIDVEVGGGQKGGLVCK